MKLIIPAYVGIANAVAGVVAERVERVENADDRGSLFYRYGITLIVVSVLVVAFTDVEHDAMGQVETFVDNIKAALTNAARIG